MGSARFPIDVTVESPGSHTGNLQPLLQEINHALQALLHEGAEHVIDVRAIPLSDTEKSQLLDFLGRGEISMRLDAMGESEIFETRYPGVWQLIHRNAEGNVLSHSLEIATVPQIARTQEGDLRDGIQALKTQLEEFEPIPIEGAHHVSRNSG